ncbi:MAG: hypothetical protein HOP02_06980 [Methylococcaceae bacterium]|nr:hypothetical protein [Methylococcaceae bacterium]
MFDNNIFLAAGNSSNHGPASNAGPVPIVVLDPATHQFTEEGLVDDEQIDSYVILNKQLYIPGHDPREDWSLGNYYKRLETGTWKKIRTIPDALHNYAMVLQNDTLFAALGIKKGGAVAVSQNQGDTWAISLITEARIYGFLQLHNKLYAVNSLKGNVENNFIYEYQGSEGFLVRADITPARLFPESVLDANKAIKISRAKAFNNAVIYIGAYTHNDHQSQPFGVYIAYSLAPKNITVKKIDLPDNIIPWDIVIHGRDAYILTSAKDIYQKPVANVIFHATTQNPQSFEPYIQFKADSFARSFELFKNVFYFGLGTEIKHSLDWNVSELNEHAGDILKLNQPIQ